MTYILAIYLAAINITGFALMGADKRRARKGLWRVPEKTLFTVALIGGALGATIAMMLFRHKTKHWYFKYGLPFITFLQMAVSFYLYTLNI